MLIRKIIIVLSFHSGNARVNVNIAMRRVVCLNKISTGTKVYRSRIRQSPEKKTTFFTHCPGFQTAVRISSSNSKPPMKICQTIRAHMFFQKFIPHTPIALEVSVEHILLVVFCRCTLDYASLPDFPGRWLQIWSERFEILSAVFLAWRGFEAECTTFECEWHILIFSGIENVENFVWVCALWNILFR